VCFVVKKGKKGSYDMLDSVFSIKLLVLSLLKKREKKKNEKTLLKKDK